MRTAFSFALGAAAGAAAAASSAASAASSAASAASTQAHHTANHMKGVAHSVTPHRHEAMDDVTLADRVRSEIFRDHDAPKGDVSIDVQAGIAYLRGTVDSDEWIQRLADDAKKVDGIKGVKNLLHRPGTPAPAAEPRGAVQDRM
jgi:osmotically-inducible protein OsmY